MTDNINTLVLNLPLLINGRKMACRSLFLYCMFLHYILMVLPLPEQLKFWIGVEVGNEKHRTAEDRQVSGRSYIFFRE